MFMQQILKGKPGMGRLLLLVAYLSSLGILATIIAIME
ncbi:hypothetical protein HNR62_002390 [Oceanisphaera litoralis]|nr:hypothetical protein [Oceanisphaera litoralis]